MARDQRARAQQVTGSEKQGTANSRESEFSAPNTDADSQQQNSDEEPQSPTCVSLQKHIKIAESQSAHAFHFVKNIFTIMTATTTFIIILVCFLFLSIVMICMGSVHYDKCPAKDAIPRHMIASGCLGSVSTLYYFVKRFTFGSSKAPNCRWNDINFGYFLAVCNLVLLLSGCDDVYSSRPSFEHKHPSDSNYCDYRIYWFTFWVITVTFVLSGVFLIVSIGLTCYAIHSPQ